MRPTVACVLLACLAAPVVSAADVATACSGRVVLDRDGDDRADPRERGLPGVKLSDGRTLAITDADGRYRLETAAGRTVQLIRPAGYAVPRRGDGLPDTWFHLAAPVPPALRFGGITSTAAACRDFALVRSPPRRAPLDVLVFGDTQPKLDVDVDYFRRDLVEPLLQPPAAALAGNAALGITLGDVVHDNLALLGAVRDQTVRLGKPWLTVPGNHDIDLDAAADEEALLSFRQVYGGDTFAWEEDAAVFVGLDDVVWRPATQDYIGGLREEQFAFLAAYLATVPRNRLVVVAAHIPFFDPLPGVETFRRADRERLFALLAPFPHVLLLTAHGHVLRQHDHDADDGWHGAAPLHEFNLGAACGAFWSGRKDAAGLPDATMADGTPNGFAVLHVAADASYSLDWHAARATGDPRLAVFAPHVLRRGAFPAFGVFANVYLGDAQTQVEFRADGGDWRPMRKVERADPAVQAENAADDLAPALRGYDRSPEATPSTHLWRGTLPTDLATGEHRVDVRARGRWMGEGAASTTYRLDDAEP
jgi:hypothetical protein